MFSEDGVGLMVGSGDACSAVVPVTGGGKVDAEGIVGRSVSVTTTGSGFPAQAANRKRAARIARGRAVADITSGT
jgi:hypothetical protein